MNVIKQPILLAIVFFQAVSAFAGTYSGGSGEPNDPYLIATPGDLNAIGNHPEDFNKCFLMINDINLAGYTSTMFNMIGDRDEAFAGSFNGNGFKIYNFTYEANGIDRVGLFGQVDDRDAEIKNVTLIDPTVSSNNGSSIAALVGRLYRGTIYNCIIKGGQITGRHAVGGFVGWNTYGKIIRCSCNTTIFCTNEYGGAVLGYNDAGEISYSSAFGHVEGNCYLGGLVGTNCGSIKHCYSKANVSGNSEIGGLVGFNIGPVIHCFAKSTVTGRNFCTGGLIGLSMKPVINCYAECSVTGEAAVGSLVGESDSYILNCWAGGDVSGTFKVGGIAGKNDGGTIENSYSKARVTGNSGIGGITGRNTREGIIAKCYSIAYVEGIYQTAGLVGDNDNIILSCFWDVDASGQGSGVADGISDETYGVRKADLKKEVTFMTKGWDFVGETANGNENIWSINNGKDYPKHVWELVNLVGWDEVNILDYSFFAKHWLQTNCPNENNCGGTDFDFSGKINYLDLTIFCQHWLEDIN